MTGCRQLFESGLEGCKLRDTVEKQYPGDQCEKESVSRCSPGPVEDSELLTRLIFHPIHVDDRGEPTSQAVSDLIERDLSVFRECHATDAEMRRVIGAIVERGRARQPPQVRRLVRVMKASAEKLRELHTDPPPKRVLRIDDTAREEEPSHASVFLTKAARNNMGTRSNMGRRAILRRTLELFLSDGVEEGARYRNGVASSCDGAA